MIQYRNVDNWKLINYQGHNIKGVYSSLGKVWPQETPPTPSVYKWLATYNGGSVSYADCDGTSAITSNEVTLGGLVDVQIGDCVITIDDNAFFYDGYRCGSLTSCTIPNSVQTIGASAFTFCTGLTSIDIPSSVRTIDDFAFYVDWSARSLTLGSGVTSIGQYAFHGCYSLTSCTIGSGVTTIGDMAFYNFKNISGVTINATTPPTIGANVFDGEDEYEEVIAYTYPIYVPCQSLAAYQTAWSEYSSRLQCIPTPSYSDQYLTFIAEGNGTFTFSPRNSNVISYSLDSGTTWVTLPSNTNTPTIQSGQTIMWKGNLSPSFNVGIGTFSSSSNFSAQGNVMSLIYGDNFSGQTSLGEDKYTFERLFEKCSTIRNAENLVLPATTLTYYCYAYMFYGCTSLTTAPELPATTLANYCYQYMFEGCTNLTTASSVLPATTLTEMCYLQMFNGCTSLTTAPELPATTLAEYCYCGMFQGCSSLTTAPQLPATTLATKCYQSMFGNCTGLTTAPVLSASTLVTECYLRMFQNCTNLNSIKCLATDISASDCTTNWVRNVASSGTFTKASSMNRWGTCGTSKIPCGWTVVDNT